jgi:hypothetical protein
MVGMRAGVKSLERNFLVFFGIAVNETLGGMAGAERRSTDARWADSPRKVEAERSMTRAWLAREGLQAPRIR